MTIGMCYRVPVDSTVDRGSAPGHRTAPWSGAVPGLGLSLVSPCAAPGLSLVWGCPWSGAVPGLGLSQVWIRLREADLILIRSTSTNNFS